MCICATRQPRDPPKSTPSGAAHPLMQTAPAGKACICTAAMLLLPLRLLVLLITVAAFLTPRHFHNHSPLHSLTSSPSPNMTGLRPSPTHPVAVPCPHTPPLPLMDTPSPKQLQ